MTQTERNATEQNSAGSLGATFENIVTGWLNSARLRVKESTHARYRNLTEKHIIPPLGKLLLDDLTTEVLEQYAITLLDNGRSDGNGGLSPKSVGDIMTVIKNVFKFAKLDSQIDWLRLRLKKTKPDIRVLTRLEQERLNSVLLDSTDRMKLGILLSLYTGIRIGELCALRGENIDLVEQTLRVQSTMQRIQVASGGTKITITPPKSDHSIRTIPLPDMLMETIKFLAVNPSAYLLTGETNRFIEPRVVQYHFKRLIKEAGIADANFHSTRHSFATRCVELGCEIKSLSETLGHSVVTITLELYVHSSFELKRNNMALLSAAFSTS